MKLTKVHIALLTNLTEGKVENEHMTMYFSKEVTAKTVIKRMDAINKLLPMELLPLFTKRITSFRSWSGETIVTPETSAERWNVPFVELLQGIERPHITLAINASRELYQEIKWAPFNWEHGLLVSQCHAGFKVGGEMTYYTVEELTAIAAMEDKYQELKNND